jgi:hypothetical protein
MAANKNTLFISGITTVSPVKASSPVSKKEKAQTGFVAVLIKLTRSHVQNTYFLCKLGLGPII